jgi:hypothetical protein
MLGSPKRIAAILSLVTLLLAGSVTVRGIAAAIPLARWTIYHVSGVTQAAWTSRYAQGVWPVNVRFRCDNGTILINVVNTDKLAQSVGARAWDVEPDEATLDKAVGSGKAMKNGGFALRAGQSTTLRLYRPALCSAGSFVFAVVYGN